MVAASLIRLLLVTAQPSISEALGTHLGSRYQISDAVSRKGFLDGLRRSCPDLVLAHEGGAQDLSLQQVLDMAQILHCGIPVVVLGEHERADSETRVLREGASGYLHLAEIARLPSVIERSLRKRRNEMHHARSKAEVLRLPGLLEESQRLLTIGRLAGSIAHEINNPLESVTNLLFLIEHEPGLSAKARDYLIMAQNELDRVAQISKQTLNFYREAALPSQIWLSTLLNEVLALYARPIAEKQLEVSRQFESEAPLVILPGEIRQVFSNLVGNAIEASAKQGKLYLRVRKSHLWGDRGITGLRVTIADNGTGMTPEVRGRVGEAFFTTKGQQGTGLGLWVSQSILERHSGKLLLRSSTGKQHGTVFSVLLPMNIRPFAVKGAKNSTRPSSGSAQRTEGSRGKPLTGWARQPAKGASALKLVRNR